MDKTVQTWSRRHVENRSRTRARLPFEIMTHPIADISGCPRVALVSCLKVGQRRTGWWPRCERRMNFSHAETKHRRCACERETRPDHHLARVTIAMIRTMTKLLTHTAGQPS